MRRLVLIVAVLMLPFLAAALDQPVTVGGTGNLHVLGDAEFEGDLVIDGDAFVGDDLTAVDLIMCTRISLANGSVTDSLYVGRVGVVTDTLYVGGNLTVADTLKVEGELKGARVWLSYGISASNQTADKWFTVGSLISTTTRGAPAAAAGSVRRYAVRYNIDSFSFGAYAVTRFYINGAKVFADSFYINSTGWHGSEGAFARDTYTFSAGDYFSVQFDINGTLQYDTPIVTLDLQEDD